jgi:hypothetical protein
VTAGSLVAEREKSHGDFRHTAALAQRIKVVYRDSRNWDQLTHVQREVLDAVATKVARILSGDPGFPDHFDDIAGYVHLALQSMDRGNG